MSSAHTTALEWALALWHAPSERFALRGKPLPVGVRDVLELASGVAPQEVSSVAARFGELESTVLDAVRFYVREVLFFTEADAYRVLGVSHDADATVIKSHARLLLHWLHPDRQQAAEDAVFASRVNNAWNQLRRPAARHAYDASLQTTASSVASDSNFLVSTQIGSLTHWPNELEQSTRFTRWRARIPLLALVAVCALLGALALRDVIQPRKQEPALDVVAKPQMQAVPTLPGVKELKPVRRFVPSREVSMRTVPTLPMAKADSEHVTPLPSITPAPMYVIAAQLPAADTARGHEHTMKPQPRTAGAMNTRANETMTVRDATDALIEPLVVAPLPNSTQIEAATVVGRQLLRYVNHANAEAPPVWNSPRSQTLAATVRDALWRDGRPRCVDPDWIVGQDRATMAVRCSTHHDPPDEPLRVTLVRREDRWLVATVALEQFR